MQTSATNSKHEMMRDAEPIESDAILIVDDHELFANGVIAALKQFGETRSIDWTDSLDGALERLGKNHYALVLLDLRLHGVSGSSAFRILRRDFPDLPIAILSAFVAPALVRQFIDEGARGVMEKDLPANVLSMAVGLMCSGAIFVPPKLLAQHQPTGSDVPGDLTGTLSTSARKFLRENGVRDCEVLVASAMCRGLSNKEIARELSLQEGTVKVYVSTILRALKVNNRVRAVLQLSKSSS